MKSCYCPRCGEKQKYRVEDPCHIIQACPGCGKSLLVKMRNGELIVRIRLAMRNSKDKAG